MSADGITISGLDDVTKWLDGLPKEAFNASKKAGREAGRATVKQIRKSIPRRWSKLVKSKVIKTRSGKVNIGMGLWAHGGRSKNNDGDMKMDWFKAYWSNYGTLENRDPGHKFQSKIKPQSTSAAKNRRNRHGQPALNFFEDAIVGWEDTYTRAFAESLKKQEKELNRKKK